MTIRSAFVTIGSGLILAAIAATAVNAAPAASVSNAVAKVPPPVVQVHGGGGHGGGGFHGGGGHGFHGGGYRGYGYGFGLYAPYTYWDYDYPSYGYYDGYYGGRCAGLHARAVETGSRYWWRRYRACIG